MPSIRTLKQVIHAQPAADGDGVKIRRIAGFDLANFSPYLMIDELKSDQSSDYIGGFPPHPHRGIETITYFLHGHFQHRDHMGNVGELRPGGAQWMAAGRGVIHSEMPIMEAGQLHGFQIWLNQPAQYKMDPARYHDFQPEVITEWSDANTGVLRVLAGVIQLHQHTQLSGPLQETGTPATIADWRATPSQTLHMDIPDSYHGLIYVYQGTINIQNARLEAGTLGVLSAGDELKLTAEQDAGVLILTGEPIHEPVVHYGPFVMTSVQEIEQAISDYNAGKFETY